MRSSPEGSSPSARIPASDRLAHELRLTLALLARERNDMDGLMDTITEGILQLGPGGVIVRANQAARVLLDLPSEPEGLDLDDLVRDRTLLARLREHEPETEALPHKVVVGGRRLLIRARPTPKRLGVGTVIVILDLTDLERFEGLRRDFVASASHELKTPLTSIRGYVELLLDQDPPAEIRTEFLEKVARNARRLEALVEDLLDLSRLDAGGWRPRLEHVDIADTVREAWAPLEERAHDQGTTLSCSLNTDSVTADRIGLVRTFTNIFDNALCHTPKGGTIQVYTTISDVGGRPMPGSRPTPAQTGSSSEPKDVPARWVKIEIADSGNGIPAEALPRIFERFYRVDTARARHDGGTGLGLAIVKHLVERMGGTVAAASVLGHGTTITLHLPVPPIPQSEGAAHQLDQDRDRA